MESMIWIEKLIVFAIAGILCAFALGVYYDRNSPIIEIKKDEWTCTRTAQITTYIMIGKMMTPVVDNICTEYKSNVQH
jgi:hypothetical protein